MKLKDWIVALLWVVVLGTLTTLVMMWGGGEG
jgi:hypothetical protein